MKTNVNCNTIKTYVSHCVPNVINLKYKYIYPSYPTVVYTYAKIGISFLIIIMARLMYVVIYFYKNFFVIKKFGRIIPMNLEIPKPMNVFAYFAYSKNDSYNNNNIIMIVVIEKYAFYVTL